MAVRSDPQTSSFSQLYDDDGDDDSDDNNFIISLEDNGDEDENYYSGRISPDFLYQGKINPDLLPGTGRKSPDTQVSEGLGGEYSYNASHQHNLAPSNHKSTLSQVISNDTKSCGEQEILTFPTSCISKPIPKTYSSLEQTSFSLAHSAKSAHQNAVEPSQDPVPFLSSYKENFSFPLSTGQPDSKVSAPTYSHHRSNTLNESPDYSEPICLNLETSNIRSEDAFQLRPDDAFVFSNGAAKEVSKEQKQTLSGTAITSLAPYIAPAENIVKSTSTFSTTTSIVNSSLTPQRDAPRLSGPFSQGTKVGSSSTESTTTHCNSCSCIMCSEIIPSSAIFSQKLPGPFLTKDEMEIIENGSYRWQHKQKNVQKSLLRPASPVNSFVPVNSTLPKLTPSRELSAALSNSSEQRKDSRQVNGNVNSTFLNIAAPPLLLHKSAVKRNIPNLNSNIAQPLSNSKVTTSQTLNLQASSHSVPSPSIVFVSSAASGKLSTTPNINQSNKTSASTLPTPLLFQGSTNGDNIGSLMVKAPSSSISSSQNLVIRSHSTSSHHDPKNALSDKGFLKPNDSDSTKISVSKRTPASVTSLNSVNFPAVPSIAEVQNIQHAQGKNPATLHNSSLLRQQLFKPAVVLPPGTAKTFQHNLGGQKSVQNTQVGSQIGSYKIVYLNSGEVLLCRSPASLQKEANHSTLPKQNVGQVIHKPLTVTGNSQALHSVLKKAEQIDLTTPGTVRIRILDSKGVAPLNVMKETSSVSSVKVCNAQVLTNAAQGQTCKPQVVTAPSSEGTVSSSSNKRKAQIKISPPCKMPVGTIQAQNHSTSASFHQSHTTFVNSNPTQVKPAQKSPLKSPNTPNVTGSTLLRLIDTHIENQQLTSSETALLQLIKGACKDPELLAATCKIAKQVESESISKSTATKESGTSNPVIQSIKSPDAAPKSSFAAKVTQPTVTSVSPSKIKQSGNSTGHLSDLKKSNERFLNGKLSSTEATKMDSKISSNRPNLNEVPESGASSHSIFPQPPLEGLPKSYIEDWVNQSKTFMSKNKLEDLFSKEVREIDRCVANEVLPHYNQSQKSEVKGTKPKPKFKQSLNSLNAMYKNAESLFHKNNNKGTMNFQNKSGENTVSERLKQKCKQSLVSKDDCLTTSGAQEKYESLSLENEDKAKIDPQDQSIVFAASEKNTKFSSNTPHARKLKHLSSLVPTSKGIKLKIRLDEKFKRHKALKKKALEKKFPQTPNVCKYDSNITKPTDCNGISDKTKDETKESLPSDGGKNLIGDDNDKKESRCETAEEMFQRFQEQAQAEVYKAQLGVGSLSRSLRPARTTVAFIDRLPARDMGCGDRKKKKSEADQTGDQSGLLVNNIEQASLKANDAEDNKDKLASCTKKKLTSSLSPKVSKPKASNIPSSFNHPNLKEDESIPFTKNVYCTNILAGHKVFVRFNTYENLSTGRSFLIPFFNIGGKRKQFDVEDITYFNKAIIDFEKEERSCARHLLYFCREGKKASFLRKEASFGASQLHEKNYFKKSFTLEGFKMSAMKPKPHTAQEAWEVDKEVDIEIDTAEVDNDVEEDFNEQYLENNDMKLNQPPEISLKENEIESLTKTPSCTDINRKPSVLDNHPSVNAEQEKALLNLQAVTDVCTVKAKPAGEKGDDCIEKSNANTDRPCSEEYTDTLPPSVPSEDPIVSNTCATEPILSLSEIKKEMPDYYDYGSEIATSASGVYQYGSADNLFQPVFPLLEVKKEPIDYCHDDDHAQFNSCTEFPSEFAKIQVMHDSNQTGGKDLSTDSSLREKEPLSVATSFVSDFECSTLESKNNKGSLVSKDFDKPEFEKPPSSIICKEIPVCNAEKVQVSLCSEQVNAVQSQDHILNKPIESIVSENKSSKSKQSESPQAPEILFEKSEDTLTGSEGYRHSCPESPAPSSFISDSSEVPSSSDIEESDLDCGLSSSEAHVSYTSTPSVDLMADAEGKAGAGTQKITSLVESLRQRLAQQSSNLPSWLADIAPPVVHSRVRTKRRKRRKCENGKNKDNIVQPSLSAQDSHQGSSGFSIAASLSETVTSSSLHQSEKAPAASNSLSCMSNKEDEGKHSTCEFVPDKEPTIDNFQSTITPHRKEVLMKNNISEDQGSNVPTSSVSSINKQNFCTEATTAEKPSLESNASMSLSLLTGFQTSHKGLTSSNSQSLSSTTFTPVVETIVKQEVMEEEICPSTAPGDHGAIAAELESVGISEQADKENPLIQSSRKENQISPEIQPSGRSTPSDVDIEVGVDDLPETALGFQPVLPNVCIDVDQSDSSSLSPVAAVVDFLHKRNQSHGKCESGSIYKNLNTHKSLAPVTKDTNPAAKDTGSVANYLAQKYAVDLTPGSGVWHTIKGPRLRRSAVKKPAVSIAKLETPAAPSSERVMIAEPISTKELFKKPSLSEIFGLPVKINSKPESEQNVIKTEPVAENDSKITKEIRGSKRQVARKSTSAKSRKKDEILPENLRHSKTEPVEPETCIEFPVPLTDSVTSLAESNISSVQSDNLQGNAVNSSQANATSSVKSKSSAKDSSSSIPKLRLTWRQLSKLSEQQQKETEEKRVDPCRVLLSRLEDTDLSSVIEPINPFTFRVRRESSNVRRDSSSVKLETDDSQADDVNKVTNANSNRGKINKRKKKKAGVCKSKKGSMKPKKDIVEHFTSMIESLRKKAQQLEEEAMKKQREEEVKQNDGDTKNICSSHTEGKGVVKKEPSMEKAVEFDKNSAHAEESEMEEVQESTETSAPLANDAKHQVDLCMDHEMQDALRQDNMVKLNQTVGTADQEGLQAVGTSTSSASKNIFAKGTNETEKTTNESTMDQEKLLTIENALEYTNKKSVDKTSNETVVSADETKLMEEIALQPISDTATSKKVADSNQAQDTEGSNHAPDTEGNIQALGTKGSIQAQDTKDSILALDTEGSPEKISMISIKAISLSNKTLDDNSLTSDFDRDEAERKGNETKQSVLFGRSDAETHKIESNKEQSVIGEKSSDKTAEIKSSILEVLGETKSNKQNESILETEKLELSQAGSAVSLSQSNLEMSVNNPAHNSETTKVRLSDEEYVVKPFDSHKSLENCTEAQDRDNESSVKSLERNSEELTNHIDASKGGSKLETIAVKDGEAVDTSMDFEEEGALVIHLPDDEAFARKYKFVRQTSIENFVVDARDIKHKDNLIAKQTSEDKMNSRKSVKEREGEAERIFYPYDIEKTPVNGRIESLNGDDESGRKCDLMNEEQAGNKILMNKIQKGENIAEEKKLTCLADDPLNFAKSDVVLSSVVDEDLAGCLVEKDLKKDELLMFEDQEDLEGDDLDILPQDEVDRLLGLCDEDSQTMVLPGLGPIPSFETAAPSTVQTESLSLQSPIENFASSHLSTNGGCSDKPVTNNEQGMKSNFGNKAQSKEAVSGREFESNVLGSSNQAFCLPSRTTIISESNTSSKVKADFDNMTNEPRNRGTAFKDSENGKSQAMQIPKLNLKLDVKAISAIQKAKTAFLRKKNGDQTENPISKLDPEPNSKNGNLIDSQFQQDMAFYMRSTKRKLADEDKLRDIRETFPAFKQQHPKSGPSTESSKTCLGTSVTGKPFSENLSISCEKRTFSVQATASIITPPKSDLLAISSVGQVKSDKTTRKRKVIKQPLLESSSPSVTKAKKVESIYDTDIFKEPLKEEPTHNSSNKSSKPVIPVSEILKKSKGIDFSKLKMKLNPLLSKSGKAPSSQSPNTTDQHHANVPEKFNHASSTRVSQIVPDSGSVENQSSNSKSLNPAKTNSIVEGEKSQSLVVDFKNLSGTSFATKEMKTTPKSEPVATDTKNSCKTSVEGCADAKSSAKPLPNLNTAKLCNLLKNIQKRPGDSKSKEDPPKIGKSSVLETKSPNSENFKSSPTRRVQRSSKQVTKKGPQSNPSSTNKSNFNPASNKSQKHSSSGSMAKSWNNSIIRASEETEDKTERSFFDCLSTDQTDIWEEATHH